MHKHIKESYYKILCNKKFKSVSLYKSQIEKYPPLELSPLVRHSTIQEPDYY